MLRYELNFWNFAVVSQTCPPNESSDGTGAADPARPRAAAGTIRHAVLCWRGPPPTRDHLKLLVRKYSIRKLNYMIITGQAASSSDLSFSDVIFINSYVV